MFETKGTSGGEAFLRVLAGMGVDRIFSSPGSEWSPVWEYLAKARAQSEGAPLYLSSRHEIAAVAMASGYAKASGKLPAVMLHTTVGALQGSMAMRAAFHESIPMVVFAGESIAFGEAEGPDPGDQWLRHLTDVGGPARLVQNCVKWSAAIRHPSTFPQMVQRACQIAMASPKGPAFLSVPMEFLFEAMTTNPLGSPSIPLMSVADPNGIAELANLLVKARNPVTITEAAGINAGVVERLIEMAELLGMPVVESRSSSFLNFPRNHPLHGGYDPKEYLADADLVLLVGAMAPWHPSSATPDGAKIAVLDEKPHPYGFTFLGLPCRPLPERRRAGLPPAAARTAEKTGLSLGLFHPGTTGALAGLQREAAAKVEGRSPGPSGAQTHQQQMGCL